MQSAGGPTAAAIYARISQDRTGAGLAVERQEAECRELAARKGWPVVKVYVDNDLSASSRKKKRPAYEAMKAEAANGGIDAIICWHIDRLTRQPLELEHVIDLAERHHLALATAQGDLDLGTPNGQATARIIGAIARQEIMHKSERQKSETKQRAHAGRPRGGARPFGYEADGVTLRADEADAIRDATRRVLEGGSLASIIREWNNRGLLTTRKLKPAEDDDESPRDEKGYLLDAEGNHVHGKWGYPALTAVLTRWRNAGVAQYLGQPLDGVEAAWAAIVTHQDMLAVRSVLADPARRTNKGGTALKHVLSGILECGKCRSPMRWGRTRTRAGIDYEVYQCPGTAGISRCRAAVLKDVAEDEVARQVARRLVLPDASILAMTAPSRSELAGLTQERARLGVDEAEVEASAVSVRIKLRMLEAIQTDREAVEARLEGLSRRDALSGLIVGLTPFLADSKADMTLGGVALREVRERLAALDLDRRRTVIRALCRVTVDPPEPGVRPTRETARRRIRVTPLDPGRSGTPLGQAPGQIKA